MMSEIKIGSFVRIPPQNLIRIVVSIQDGEAMVIRTDRKGEPEGPFALENLTVDKPIGPMKFIF